MVFYQSSEMVSYMTLFERPEDFRRDQQEANGPEIILSRLMLIRLRYHDYVGHLAFSGEEGQPETSFEQVDQSSFPGSESR